MNEQCVNMLPIAGALFGASIIAANLASWRMGKNYRPTFAKTEVAKWKLLLNHALEVEPAEMLTERGVFWRRVSLWSVGSIVITAAAYAYLRSQSWVCQFG